MESSFRALFRLVELTTMADQAPAAAAAPVVAEDDTLPADAVAGGQGAGQQASSLENYLLARAWIAVSEDSTVGSDQTAQSFKTKFHENFYRLRRTYVQQRKAGWQNINMNRALNFPSLQWTRIRKATYVCMAVRKCFPKKSGETNKETWYARIRPHIADGLKKKNIAHTKPQRFESVADYLEKFPKFCSHMDQKEAVNRPVGKRRAQQDAQLSDVCQRVEAESGLANRSILEGGAPAQQGIQAMSALFNQAFAQNQQMLATAMHSQQMAAHNQMHALVMALKPEQLAALDAAQPPPLPPNNVPLVPLQQAPPPAERASVVRLAGEDEAAAVVDHVVAHKENDQRAEHDDRNNNTNNNDVDNIEGEDDDDDDVLEDSAL